MTGSAMFKAVPAMALMLVAAVPAASLAADVRPVLRGGYDTGGDKIVTAIFSNGSTKSIKANEGFYVGGGASFLNDSKNIETEVTANVKYASITASNGDITWIRYPLEALVFYRMPQFRVGGGVTYHVGPKLSGSGVVGGLNVKVDDALGVVLQGDYLFTQKASLGLRYTNLSYKANGVSANSNGVGVTFGVRF
jgi:outer membrane protein with beta-barrel domain